MDNYLTLWHHADLELRLYPHFYLILDHGSPSHPIFSQHDALVDYHRRLTQRGTPSPSEEDTRPLHIP